MTLATTAATIPASTAQPDLSTLPRRSDRKTGAKLVEQFYFPVRPRTLEIWPLDWVLVNGKAVCETAELFAVAQAKLDAASRIRSVRRRTPAGDRRIEAAAAFQSAE